MSMESHLVLDLEMEMEAVKMEMTKQGNSIGMGLVGYAICWFGFKMYGVIFHKYVSKGSIIGYITGVLLKAF